jgi:hypothetical protein
MDQFFMDDGSQYLVFFYQEPEPENYQGEIFSPFFNFNNKIFLAESYRPGLAPYSNRSSSTTQKHTKPKVIIADLQAQSLQGICLVFLRNSKKTVITGQNIVNVCLIIFHFSFHLFFHIGSFLLYI